MTNRTMNKHIICALEIKAKIKALEEELKVHEDCIKKGIKDSGTEKYEGNGHKATYNESVQLRFNKEVFISRYSEQEYNDCKAPVKRTYFTYA